MLKSINNALLLRKNYFVRLTITGKKYIIIY